MAENKHRSFNEEVDHLMRNAQLRDDLEPYLDESICRVNVSELTTPKENEFLASMLAWERAPVLPISEWFDPKLSIPTPDSFGVDQSGKLALHQALWDVIYRLFEKNIVLEFTEHLSDYDFYCLIYRDILPSHEKKVELQDSYLHWDCADASGNSDVWLRYYATDEDREMWEEETGEQPPSRETPPFPRRLPRRPL